jgi:hypothetical protein
MIISISPTVSKVLFDEVNSMSPGKYRDTSENILSKEVLEKRMIIIGWEDTKVYEFYFSTLGMGEGFNLKFKSRFDQDFSVEEKANLLILSSDAPISPEFTTWLSNKGFLCSDIGLTNRKTIKCDYQLISTY